jgi:hypothetical protein
MQTPKGWFLTIMRSLRTASDAGLEPVRERMMTMTDTIAGVVGSRWAGHGTNNLRWAMLAALFAVHLGAYPGPVLKAESLRWKFKAGEVVRYTMVQETSQEMKGQGQEAKTSLNQTVDLHWSVKSVSPGGVADMTQTIDRVRTKIQGPGQTFEFDSDSGKAPEGPGAQFLGPILKSLVGAEFSFKMSGRGELSEIKVPQKLLETLRQAGPAASAGGMFSEEGMKNLISQSSLTLPDTSLDQGKSWTQQSKLPVPMIGTMVLDKTYTYMGPEAKDPTLRHITLETKITLQPAADANVAVTIKSQAGKGDFSFDADGGRIVTSRVNDKLQMSLSAMGQDIEQSTNTLTTMTLAKDGTPK